MKKISFQIIALFFMYPFLGCDSDDQFKGSGNIIEQNREVDPFTKVESSTSINVEVIAGTTQELLIRADDNVINSVRTGVENGVLKIDLEAGNYIDVTITVAIAIPNLNGLKSTGSGNMTISGFENLTNLDIDNTGSGSVNISGSGNSLSIQNRGSGGYNGFDFIVKNCKVTNSGSGSCEINCTETLNGTNSGSGNILYRGNATVTVSNTGSGQVINSN